MIESRGGAPALSVRESHSKGVILGSKPRGYAEGSFQQRELPAKRHQQYTPHEAIPSQVRGKKRTDIRKELSTRQFHLIYVPETVGEHARV